MARPQSVNVAVKLKSQVTTTEEFEYTDHGLLAKKTTTVSESPSKSPIQNELLLFSEWLDMSGYMKDDAHPERTHEEIVQRYLDGKEK